MPRKYARIRKCDLCGQAYAVLPGQFRFDNYTKRYCPTCTKIILDVIRKLKTAMELAR